MAYVGPKFVFIHIYKTGGNSVRRALHLNRVEEVSGVHSNVTQTLTAIGEETYHSKFSFAFVRHPYPWCLSLYHYILRAKLHQHHLRVAKMNLFQFVHFLGNDLFHMQYKPAENRHQTLTSFLSHNGKIDLSYVARFDKLNQELLEIATRLEIPLQRKDIPRANAGHHVRRVLTQPEKEAVYKYFQEDFDNFHFQR